MYYVAIKQILTTNPIDSLEIRISGVFVVVVVSCVTEHSILVRNWMKYNLIID